MRNSVKSAILLSKRDTGEKDVLCEFLSEDDNIILVKDYSSQKSGSKSFIMYSTGDIYLYKKEDTLIHTLKDSKISTLRAKIFKNVDIETLSLFTLAIKCFSKFGFSGLFDFVNYVFDFLDKGDDADILFVYFVENFFTQHTSKLVYDFCPSCESQYSQDDIIGYSAELHSPVCAKCAQHPNTILPGMRRYLRFVSSNEYEKIKDTDIHKRALDNVMRFEKFRLHLIQPSLFKKV